MIKENPQKSEQKPLQSNFPFLINNKNIVIKRKFDIVAQSNISISTLGRLAICQPTCCVIVDLVHRLKTQYRIIPILEGDSYHWVYSWNQGFLIVGDVHTQFIDYDYKLSNMNIVIERLFYFQTNQQLYIVQTDEEKGNQPQAKYMRNFKDSEQTEQQIPLRNKEKLKGYINLLEPEFIIDNDDKTVQSHSFSFNLNTKEKQIVIIPQNTLNYLRIDNDTIIYITHGEGTNTINVKDLRTDEVTQVTKIPRPNSYSFKTISEKHHLVSIHDGYRIKLINYKTKTIIELQDLFPKSIRKSDCQVMSGDSKYFALIKATEDSLYLNCYSIYNENKAKIHCFSNSHLMEKFGRGLLDTMLLKI